MTDLQGATALITGGASGIGRLLAERLADRGATLVLWDRDPAALEGAVAALRERGAGAHGYVVDVTDRAVVASTADTVRAEVGEVDVVVNNAGVVNGKPLMEISDADIERTFAVNTLALYWVTRAFLPGMIARDSGHVVTVASAAGLLGVARQTDYSASKHAAVGFDESLRVELRRTSPGVRTTVICPYFVNTGMFDGVKTRVPWLLPILDQEQVASRIALAIARDEPRVILPWAVRLVPFLRGLPTSVFDWSMNLLGVNVSMEEFHGRVVVGAAPVPDEQLEQLEAAVDAAS